MVGRGWLMHLLRGAHARVGPGSGQLELPFPGGMLVPGTIPLGGAAEGRLSVELCEWGTRIALRLPVVAAPEVPGDELVVFFDGEPCAVHYDPGLHEAGTPDEPALPAPTDQTWNATVKVTPRASASVPRVGGGAFLLVPGLGRDRGESTRSILRVLRLIVDSLFARSGQLHLPSLSAAARLLTAAAAHVPALCSPTALQASRGFPGGGMMHWFVYESVVNDPTGRVAQIADVCPGLLVLARGLRSCGAGDRCDELLAAIRSGAKLGSILDFGLDAWTRQLAPGEIRIQRLRIRRAGMLVRPSTLLTRPVPGVAATDIPTDEQLNARWFEVTSHDLLWRPPGPEQDGALAPRQLRGLGGFLSRHWRAIDDHAGRTHGLETVLRELVDFVRFSGRCPGRRTDPVRLIDECRRWHEQPHWEHHVTLPPDTPLGTAGLSGWIGRGVTVTPLRTVGELIRESRAMRHCVAWHAKRAAAGEVQIFHATVDGQRLTVMTDRRGGRLRVIEAAGVCNRPPTSEVNDRLALWIGRAGQDDSDPE